MHLFGVVGNPISHSMSPQIMNAAIEAMQMDAVYTRFLLADIKELKSIIKLLNPTGFSITAPFKKEVLELVNSPDADVQFLGAANTLTIKNDLISAFNTDVKGVLEPIRQQRTDLSQNKVLILGAGGASLAVLYALRNESAELYLCNRSAEKMENLSSRFEFTTLNFEDLAGKGRDFDIIINTIPLWIKAFEYLEFHSGQIIFDAAYKSAPLKAQALEANANYINGAEWLLAQAKYAFNHFTGHWIDGSVMASAIKNVYNGVEKNPEKLILIGPMGAGKSSLGKRLAQKLAYKFIDLDSFIEQRAGKTITEIFQLGEAEFRSLEKECLKEVMENDQMVLACGGGIVLDPANRKLIKEGQVIFLYVTPQQTIERTKGKQRPLLKLKDPLSMAEEILSDRLPLYLSSADVVINNCYDSVEELLTLVYEDYNQTFRF